MIKGSTKVIALLGDPVEHSISPEMQNAALEKKKLDFVYVAFKVPEKYVEESIKGIKSLGLKGANVTIPHKSAVMKYLDELDEISQKIGAVNTINEENGKLKGYNTDGKGALRALRRKIGEIRGKEVLILGAGGAARAIAFTLIESGANLKISNRTETKANDLAAELKDKTGKSVTQIPQKSRELENSIKESDILINSTSVGMHPKTDETIVDSEMMHSNLTVMDIVYNPLKTLLLREADKAGAKTISGIEMLIQQGAESFEIWTGKKAPINVMRDYAIKAMERR